jgi:predicted DCC family thiol-disulfide oxidoreductase YuxK
MALSDEMMQEGSVIVEADGKVYRRFAAIRHILFLMGWPWRAFAYLPEWIGDPCYRWVARLR